MRWKRSHVLLALLATFVALAARAAFVDWAPGVLNGDGIFYNFAARQLAQGGGYVEADHSPGIQWMPGWPYLLSLVYRVTGPEPRAGMFANAVFGGLTAGLVFVLGRRLFGPRVGAFAGLAYALWPGNVYYAATLTTEPCFSLLLAGFLVTLAAALRAAGRRRTAGFACAGLLLGAMALVRSEPLILGAVLALAAWVARASRAEFARNTALAAVLAAAVVAPWVVRNWVTFDRFIVTSASGGGIAWLGNHPGASGTNDFYAMRAYLRRHRGATHADTVLAADRAGWRDAWRFASGSPGEWLAIVADKLRFTYGSDSEAVGHIRSVSRASRARMSYRTDVRLRRLADGTWYAMLALVVVGVTGVRRFSSEARVLLFGPIGCWLLLHVVFLGGPRFHVPEQIAYAVLAGCGMQRLLDVRIWRRDAALSDGAPGGGREPGDRGDPGEPSETRATGTVGPGVSKRVPATIVLPLLIACSSEPVLEAHLAIDPDRPPIGEPRRVECPDCPSLDYRLPSGETRSVAIDPDPLYSLRPSDIARLEIQELRSAHVLGVTSYVVVAEATREWLAETDPVRESHPTETIAWLLEGELLAVTKSASEIAIFGCEHQALELASRLDRPVKRIRESEEDYRKRVEETNALYARILEDARSDPQRLAGVAGLSPSDVDRLTSEGIPRFPVPADVYFGPDHELQRCREPPLEKGPMRDPDGPREPTERR